MPEKKRLFEWEEEDMVTSVLILLVVVFLCFTAGVVVKNIFLNDNPKVSLACEDGIGYFVYENDDIIPGITGQFLITSEEKKVMTPQQYEEFCLKGATK